jgi:hypothetical protein
MSFQSSFACKSRFTDFASEINFGQMSFHVSQKRSLRLRLKFALGARELSVLMNSSMLAKRFRCIKSFAAALDLAEVAHNFLVLLFNVMATSLLGDELLATVTAFEVATLGNIAFVCCFVKTTDFGLFEDFCAKAADELS